MGWSNGEDLFQKVLRLCSPHVQDNFDDFVYKLVELFEDYDADTLFDTMSVGDNSDVMWRVYKRMYPNEVEQLLDDFNGAFDD